MFAVVNDREQSALLFKVNILDISKTWLHCQSISSCWTESPWMINYADVKMEHYLTEDIAVQVILLMPVF